MFTFEQDNATAHRTYNTPLDLLATYLFKQFTVTQIRTRRQANTN